MRRMARTMRFHLDEHVPHAIAEGLRRRGIDVTTTVEAGLRGTSDAPSASRPVNYYDFSNTLILAIALDAGCTRLYSKVRYRLDM